MSISQAIMAHMSGDTAEADRQLDKATLKRAVCHLMFCPGIKGCGGNILDVRRAVRVETPNGSGAITLCAGCFDAWRAGVPSAELAGLKIIDGRVLHARKPRKAAVRKTELIRGTALNGETGETREVSLTEAQVALILGDEEHDTCAGECACQIEPDGECENGWSSRMRAVGMV